jgi:septum formation topological specificity factor MinE
MKKSIFTNLMKRIDQSFIDVDKINNEFIDVIKKYIEIDVKD